ncbi:DUF2156 domain-containing protein [Bifidobacterium boum]|uniref:DUF2156 domain-containing protein n=1 Tax=Bifidobacterium boum TaxID=78343 RepID=A0A848D7V5_9BIFI|nr:DUF2156 domain-containing protein [Bifidobacterium boum]NMF02498.1 DUF2156 domain-containing protein [Bifidobacterium boum]
MTQTTQQPPHAQPTPHPTGWKALTTDARDWWTTHWMGPVAAGIFIVVNITVWIWRLTHHIIHRPQDMTMLRIFGHHASSGHPDMLGQFFKLLWSMVLARGPFSLVLYAVAILAIFSAAQAAIGVTRTLATALLGAIAGSALGLGLCAVMTNLWDEYTWHAVQRMPFSLSPITLSIAALMAASAFEPILWRRRIRLIAYAFILAAMLFSGNPGDYCTLAAALVGHGVGVLMFRRQHHEREHEQWWRGTDYEVRRLIAAIQLVFAFGPILALVSSSHDGPLSVFGYFLSGLVGDEDLADTCASNLGAHSCVTLAKHYHFAMTGVWVRTLVLVVAMMILAWGLYRGRRLAAHASMVLNGFTVAVSVTYCVILPLLDSMTMPIAADLWAVLVQALIATAVPSLVLMAVIGMNMDHFSVLTARSRIRRGVGAIGLALLITAGSFLAFGMMDRDAYAPRATFGMLLRDLPHRYLPMGLIGSSRLHMHSTTVASMVINQLPGLVFWIVVLVVFLLWFRDSVALNAADREHASTLVERGGESMSFMTTWEDNHYWFSPSGRSAIAYRVSHGVALTVTGPFGDPGEFDTSLREFMRFCERNSWSPAFYAVHDNARETLESLGCSSIQVGTEMLVIPSTWQTRGKKWQDIRTAINKARRSGLTDVLTTFNEAPWEVREQIIGISEQWAELKSLPEMKFTLGGVEELRDPRVMLLYAIDADGVVQGATSWLPTYRDGKVIGWTLDFMRHRTDSPNGIMEFLIARMAERLHEQCVEEPDQAAQFMSLSAAPLAGIGDNTADPEDIAVIEHVLQIVADTLEPAYGFKSLYFFKRKFQPTPSPIYVCYPDAAALPRIGLAVLSAYLPGLKPSQIPDMLKSLRPAPKAKGHGHQ